MYLDPAARETPVVALGGAAREALRLSDVLETMLTGLRDAFDRGDRNLIAETKRLDDVIDKLNTAIKAYITSLDASALGDADHRRVHEILAFATNMEQAADIVEKDLLGIVSKKIKRGLAFSESGQSDLMQMLDQLLVNVRTAASLFAGTERRRRATARVAVYWRKRGDIPCHGDGCHGGTFRAPALYNRIDTAETNALHLDALRYLKSVNAHLVAGAAYPLLESQGRAAGQPAAAGLVTGAHPAAAEKLAAAIIHHATVYGLRAALRDRSACSTSRR